MRDAMKNENTRRAPKVGLLASAIAAGGLALIAPNALAEPVDAASAPVVGRAVSVRGTVYAIPPDGNPRILQCRDPIYDGDKVVTEENAAVGIDSGTYYLRLDERSELGMSALPSGAPRADLARGHVRVIDSAGPGSPSAEVATPTLQVARTGPDLDAIVYGEKATAVSMVCAYESPIDVARRGNAAESLAAAPDSCVVGKPNEPLYAQQATHPKLAVLMADACGPADLPVAGLFSPTSVALGPTTTGGSSAPAPEPSLFAPGGVNVACAPSCQQPPPPPPALPTQFPFNPPVLPAP